jgi:hypothetical protein
MLLVGPNSAPNSGRIPPLEALAAPGVRIHPAPPASPYLWGHSLQDGEIARDCGVICRFGGTGEDHLLLVRAQDAAKVSVGK